MIVTTHLHMTHIISYESINKIAFGVQESCVIAVFGTPERRTHNRAGDQELHYPGIILRHEAPSGALREVTLLPGCNGTINGIAILWTTEFLDWLAVEDTELQECVGFVVSLKLGIMVSGFHDDDESQKAIHVFRKGDMDVLADKMRSFFWKGTKL
ncbi:hypothetical protein [Janthinobacterium sp. 67]|uniref:hypothetical protein n=1 Tax=Janthinobacterium sp. 67 TaxID=2035207 RepID=UPI000C23F14E|nr:hypothetical protein [Janthinobacterium sp. 67]